MSVCCIRKVKPDIHRSKYTAFYVPEIGIFVKTLWKKEPTTHKRTSRLFKHVFRTHSKDLKYKSFFPFTEIFSKVFSLMVVNSRWVGCIGFDATLKVNPRWVGCIGV